MNAVFCRGLDHRQGCQPDSISNKSTCGGTLLLEHTEKVTSFSIHSKNLPNPRKPPKNTQLLGTWGWKFRSQNRMYFWTQKITFGKNCQNPSKLRGKRRISRSQPQDAKNATKPRHSIGLIHISPAIKSCKKGRVFTQSRCIFKRGVLSDQTNVTWSYAHRCLSPSLGMPDEIRGPHPS